MLISETATSMLAPSSILYFDGISFERNKAVIPLENSTIYPEGTALFINPFNT